MPERIAPSSVDPTPARRVGWPGTAIRVRHHVNCIRICWLPFRRGEIIPACPLSAPSCARDGAHLA
jgi:hypothetical protein